MLPDSDLDTKNQKTNLTSTILEGQLLPQHHNNSFGLVEQYVVAHLSSSLIKDKLILMDNTSNLNLNNNRADQDLISLEESTCQVSDHHIYSFMPWNGTTLGDEDLPIEDIIITTTPFLSQPEIPTPNLLFSTLEDKSTIQDLEPEPTSKELAITTSVSTPTMQPFVWNQTPT